MPNRIIMNGKGECCRGLMTVPAVLLVLGTGAGTVSGAAVRFAMDEYSAVAGEPVQIQSLIELAAGEDPLFSFGVALLLESGDPASVEFVSAAAPPELDFNGPAGSGALTETAAGFAGVKGTVDSSNDPLVGYAGPEFANFALRFSEPGTYTLRSDFLQYPRTKRGDLRNHVGHGSGRGHELRHRIGDRGSGARTGSCGIAGAGFARAAEKQKRKTAGPSRMTDDAANRDRRLYDELGIAGVVNSTG